jgi:hypothetical protein
LAACSGMDRIRQETLQQGGRFSVARAGDRSWGRRVQDTDLPTLLPALEAATAGGHAGEGLVRFLETMPAAW